MDVPELTNFGSLVRHALRIEDTCAGFYEALAQSAGPLGALARELALQHRERRRQVEQARQRFLNEVILEPISTLDGARYVLDPGSHADADAVAQAVALEETARRFYEDAAEVARSMLAEAVRSFRKLAEGNAQNGARLRAIGGA